MKATILKALFIAPFVGWAGCLWVPTDGYALFGWATPSGQPALALRVEPQERLAANALRSGAEAQR
jgi:hypothetical protein